MKSKAILVTILFLSFSTAYAEDERVAIVCVGEHRNFCAPNTTIHVPCHSTSIEDTAESFCTINTANGKKIVPYFLDHLSTEGGNKCGYNMYRVSCELDWKSKK